MLRRRDASACAALASSSSFATRSRSRLRSASAAACCARYCCATSAVVASSGTAAATSSACWRAADRMPSASFRVARSRLSACFAVSRFAAAMISSDCACALETSSVACNALLSSPASENCCKRASTACASCSWSKADWVRRCTSVSSIPRLSSSISALNLDSAVPNSSPPPCVAAAKSCDTLARWAVSCCCEAGEAPRSPPTRGGKLAGPSCTAPQSVDELLLPLGRARASECAGAPGGERLVSLRRGPVLRSRRRGPAPWASESPSSPIRPAKTLPQALFSRSSTRRPMRSIRRCLDAALLSLAREAAPSDTEDTEDRIGECRPSSSLPPSLRMPDTVASHFSSPPPRRSAPRLAVVSAHVDTASRTRPPRRSAGLPPSLPESSLSASRMSTSAVSCAHSATERCASAGRTIRAERLLCPAISASTAFSLTALITLARTNTMAECGGARGGGSGHRGLKLNWWSGNEFPRHYLHHRPHRERRASGSTTTRQLLNRRRARARR